MQGIEEIYCRSLEDLYSDGTATIEIHAETDKILIENGVRQGDTISPKLFTTCLEEVYKKLDWKEKGIKIGNEHLSHLRFADYIVLFGESSDELQQLLSDLNRESLKISLKMNMKKSKFMFKSRTPLE